MSFTNLFLFSLFEALTQAAPIIMMPKHNTTIPCHRNTTLPYNFPIPPKPTLTILPGTALVIAPGNPLLTTPVPVSHESEDHSTQGTMLAGAIAFALIFTFLIIVTVWSCTRVQKQPGNFRRRRISGVEEVRAV